MEHNVALIRCNDYNVDSLVEVFRNSISLLRIDVHSMRNKKVLIKPNMLGAYPPEMGITTRPEFVEAAIIVFQDLGCTVWVGDSPNGIFPIDCVWERTGIRDVCKRREAIEKIFEKESSELRDDILISKPVLDADYLVNLPKFKTHGLTVLTVAVKNLYGCVPGLQKSAYHRDVQNHQDFAKLVVRISRVARPSINFVDGIEAMEGTGPSAGRLTKLNTVIVGANPHAVDSVCARLVGLDPYDVDTLAAARDLGIWSDAEKIKLVGEKLDACRPPSFQLPVTFTKGMRDWWISKFVVDRIWQNVSIKPSIDKKKCKRCGMCVKACPVNAIVVAKDFPIMFESCGDPPPGYSKYQAPRVLNEKCVMCYCCHEICPYKAVDLNESLGVKIGRFLGERNIRKTKNNNQ